MIIIIKQISEVGMSGKAEVLVTPIASKSYPKDIPTGIFVDPHFFRRGDIYVNAKDIFCRTAEEMEMGRFAKRSLDKVCRRIYNIVRVTEDLDVAISKEDILSVLSAEESLPKVGNWIRREDICRLLSLSIPSQRLRYSNHRKLYDFFIEYAMRRGLGDHQIALDMTFVRKMYRFELYQRIVRKKICFSLNVDVITQKDVFDLHQYLEHEYEYMNENPEAMALIIQKTDLVMSRNTHPRVQRNKKSNVIAKMRIINSIMSWLLKERETDNNPFEQYEIGRSREKENIINLTHLELTKLSSHDFKGQRTRELIRDLFIFQCHTGCRYNDLRYLTQDNLHDEILSYTPRRILYSLYPPIPEIHLDKACLKLISKHQGEDEDGRFFCCPHKTVFDSLLKVIFKECGLDRMVANKDTNNKRKSLVHMYEIASSELALHTFQLSANGTGDSEQDTPSGSDTDQITTYKTNICKALIEMLE